MATTRLSDIIVPKVFTALVNGAVIEKSTLRKAGVILSRPDFDARAQGAGFETTMPFWSPIAWSEANSSGDDPAVFAVPQKTSQAQMTAKRFHRNKTFQAMDIINAAAGTDASAFAISQLADAWAQEEEYLAMKMVEGLRLKNVASNSGDMSLSISITTGTIVDANRLTPTSLITLKSTLGDAAQGGFVDTIVMHSDVFHGIQKNEANAFVPASKTDLGFATYLGYKVVVSDKCTKDITVPAYPVYTSFLCGSGLFGVGVGASETVLERSELAGNGSGVESLISRRAFILHPAGHNITTAPANGVSFTNAEMAVAAPWARVVDRKAVPLAIIRTNV